MKEFDHPQKSEISLCNVLLALGDPIRLSIVSQLASESCEIGWGAFEVAVGKATLSHHMKSLRMAGLINHRKEGTRCYVALRPELESLFPGLLSSILKASHSGSEHSAY
ncbi:MAG: ArsR family transcriptional regulator [Proteobacteria bacterium]|nr:MAG: ArsR family transcriptional regulator [Pseudomonadota bacterium]